LVRGLKKTKTKRRNIDKSSAPMDCFPNEFHPKVNKQPNYKDETENTMDSDSDADRIPLEIDTHFQLYGKHAWEVQYGERCPLCNQRIDEYGFCACGSHGVG
jgi:hypothetical protein